VAILHLEWLIYDYIRPKIIHENNLVKLCELCTLLQTRYMRDLEDRSSHNPEIVISGSLKDS
jgi:hypothetical protein